MSTTPTFLRGNYSDLYSSSQLPVLEAVFRWNLMQAAQSKSLRDLMNTRKTQRDIYQTSEVGDLPMFNSISEGTDYSYAATNQGASKTIVPVKYGLGFSISEEAVDDGKFDEIADMTAKLAKSARESQEVQAASIFNNAFGSQTTADGLALCHTAHTLPTGLTFRNRMSSDADLSTTSLETALIDFETQFIGDTGVVYLKKPSKLLCHPTFARTAREILGSDLKANTSDNNMNPFKSEGIEVVSSPHLTDTDAWFLLSEKSETGLDIISRKGITTKASGPDAGFDNDSMKFKSSYREKIDTVHAYGVYGSTGA